MFRFKFLKFVKGTAITVTMKHWRYTAKCMTHCMWTKLKKKKKKEERIPPALLKKQTILAWINTLAVLQFCNPTNFFLVYKRDGLRSFAKYFGYVLTWRFSKTYCNISVIIEFLSFGGTNKKSARGQFRVTWKHVACFKGMSFESKNNTSPSFTVSSPLSIPSTTSVIWRFFLLIFSCVATSFHRSAFGLFFLGTPAVLDRRAAPSPWNIEDIRPSVWNRRGTLQTN